MEAMHPDVDHILFTEEEIAAKLGDPTQLAGQFEAPSARAAAVKRRSPSRCSA